MKSVVRVRHRFSMASILFQRSRASDAKRRAGPALPRERRGALSLPAAIMWAPGMSSPSFAKISRSVFTTLFPVLPELPTTSTRPNFVDPVLAALASVALDASPFVRRFAPGIVSPLLFAVNSASGPPPFIELPVDVESPRSAETAIMVVVASVARHRTPRSRRISYRRFSASA